MNSGRAGGRAVAASGTSPGPGLGIKVASGPGGALGGRCIIIQYGRGVRSSPSKSCRISFLFIQSIFVPLIFFLFPSGYRTSSKGEGLELTLAMSQHMDIDPGVPALLRLAI